MTGPHVIFYDGRCRLCMASTRALRRLDARRQLRFTDTHDLATMRRYPELTPDMTQGQMWVLTPDGRLYGGYDALVCLLPAFGAPRWLVHFLQSEPLRTVGRRAYQWLARHRYQLGGMLPCSQGVCERR